MKRILAALIMGLLTSLVLRYSHSSYPDSDLITYLYIGSWTLTQWLALYVLLQRNRFMKSLYSITFGTSFLVFLAGRFMYYMEWPGNAFVSSFALFAMMAVYLVYFLFKDKKSFLDALSLVVVLSYCTRAILFNSANTLMGEVTFQTWQAVQIVLLCLGVALEIRQHGGTPSA